MSIFIIGLICEDFNLTIQRAYSSPFFWLGGSTVKGKRTPVFQDRSFQPGTSGDLHSAQLTSPSETLPRIYAFPRPPHSDKNYVIPNFHQPMT